MAGYLTRSGAELGEKLFQEVRLLLNDTDTIREHDQARLNERTFGKWSNSTLKLSRLAQEAFLLAAQAEGN